MNKTKLLEKLEDVEILIREYGRLYNLGLVTEKSFEIPHKAVLNIIYELKNET